MNSNIIILLCMNFPVICSTYIIYCTYFCKKHDVSSNLTLLSYNIKEIIIVPPRTTTTKNMCVFIFAQLWSI